MDKIKYETERKDNGKDKVTGQPKKGPEEE
jgi:hypothetical protein